MTEHGICAKCKKSVGCPYADDRITGCKNFVLEPELKLTNEENLRQCNTEQLADAFFEYRYVNATPKQKLWMSASEECIKTDIVEWLKQPHTKGDSE